MLPRGVEQPQISLKQASQLVFHLLCEDLRSGGEAAVIFSNAPADLIQVGISQADLRGNFLKHIVETPIILAFFLRILPGPDKTLKPAVLRYQRQVHQLESGAQEQGQSAP